LVNCVSSVYIIQHISNNVSFYINGIIYDNTVLLIILNFTYFLFKSKCVTVSVVGINYISIIALSLLNIKTIIILFDRLLWSTNGNGYYSLFNFLPYKIYTELLNMFSIPTTLLNSEYTLILSNADDYCYLSFKSLIKFKYTSLSLNVSLNTGMIKFTFYSNTYLLDNVSSFIEYI